jgi:2-keto-4-pentenoate hydratase/2-oxohepta-3-ene-1,7-dioic acid hydratase in catechol pathway
VKLAHYLQKGERRVGIVKDGLLFDIREAGERLEILKRNEVSTINQLLSAGAIGLLKENEEKIAAASAGVPAERVKLLSPIQNPEKILLAAVNYNSHIREQEVKPPAEPYLFARFRNALIGPGDPILIPKVSETVDWEVELAVVIGKAHPECGRNELCRGLCHI